jgi:outer membrane protein assembly factor BamD (BamD/ComL family)
MCYDHLKSGFAIIVLSAALLLTGAVAAETWQLKQGKDWQKIAAQADGEYMLAFAGIKQMIDTGQPKSAMAQLARLKENFTEIVGPDLDAFMAAEMLYAKKQWSKAIKQYDEFLATFPDSRFYESAIEREYSIAVAYLGGEKRRVLKILKLSAFDDGAAIMRRIADRSGEAPIAKRALIALAQAHEKKDEYIEAYEVWADIYARWTTGDTGRQALLAMAQTLHSAYKSPKHDPTVLDSARSYYESFRDKYPGLARDYEVAAKIEMIDEQLAYKQFAIGQYYEKTDSLQAANLYYQQVIDTWPGSTAAQMAKARMDAIISNEQGRTPGQKRNLHRRMFEATSEFLDNWFGILKLKKSPQE